MKIEIIFSTREISLIIWSTIIIVILLISQKTREAVMNVVKAACNKQIISHVVIMFLYAVVLIFLFSKVQFWEWKYIKDICVWVLFAGIPLCFNATQRNLDAEYFRNMIIDNLKFIVLIGFLLSTFTFSIYFEIVMVPVVSFIVIFEAVAKSSEKFKIVEKMCSYLLMIIGFSLLAYTLKIAINEYKSLGLFDTLIVFSIPLILSILYLPIAYVFAIHSKYQMIFIRVAWNKNLTKEQERKRKWEIFKACRFSRKKLFAFEKAYVKLL